MSDWPEREPIFGALSFDELTIVRDVLRYRQSDLEQQERGIFEGIRVRAIPEELRHPLIHNPILAGLHQQIMSIQALAHQADSECIERFEAEWVDPEEEVA